MTDSITGYPRPAGGAPNFPSLELEVLDYWARDDTFRASVARRDGAEEYVFYDGPPFANGLPHYGHLLTGYVKDIVPRYRTMRGYKVERRFGWDTHGLPAELEVERQLGITDKSQIDDMGIAAFNDACRASVLRYTDEWQAYVTRQARWVDFDNDYKTLDLPYMESVIWAFSQLWEKGLAYEGYRVLPYCWRDETPLSNHELRMDDDVYQSRQDPALTVGFKITGGDLDEAYLLVWTTTPWTLPSNLAVAVNPDVTYVQVRAGEHRFLLAEARVPGYVRELGENLEILATYRGADLLGTRYLPPFPYFMDTANAFQVLPGDFVTTDDGTGIVHMAPAYGEDDMATTDRVGIVPVTPVDARGRFDASVPDYQGQRVFDANPHIIRDLKNGSGPAAANGAVLLRHETYDHPYPHCWRCRNPLIYRAVSSWFVRVTEFRDRMVELNQQITWYPEHVKDGQFGKWLQGARDWSISRNRYWGTPIPVWKSDDPAYPRIDVYGSLDELERDFGVRPDQPAPALHRRADPAQPRRPDRARPRCGASPTCSTCGSTPVRCRMPRCTIRSRTPSGSRAGPRERMRTTRPTSSSSTSARPAAGSTPCTCWRPRSSTGPPSKPVWPRHRAGQRRAEDEQVAAQLPRRVRGVRPRRFRRHALVPDGVADPARRQPHRDRAGHPRGRSAGPAAAVERLQLPRRSTRRKSAPGAPIRRTCWTATSWPSSPCCATS